MDNSYPLTKENVCNLIGKKIKFEAPSFKANELYTGIVVINSVDFNKKHPISCKLISGDNLEYAFLDNHGLETLDNGATYIITDTCTSFTYSDRDREVFVTEI